MISEAERRFPQLKTENLHAKRQSANVALHREVTASRPGTKFPEDDEEAVRNFLETLKRVIEQAPNIEDRRR